MIALSDRLRARHIYVIGKTQTGKSTLLLKMLRQDIQSGKGVCFIDPHGDAAEAVLTLVPKERVPDTLYFEPTEFPLGLQSFATESETEAELLCDDLITVFRRLSQSWGERMDALFRFAFYTLIRTPGSTLLNLYDLFTDEAFRTKAVSGLRDPILMRFWNEYPSEEYPKGSAMPILVRMAKFVTSPTLSRIFGTSEAIDLADLMDRKQILIVNLGLVGADIRSILGTIIVSTIQIAALRRAKLPPRKRVPFFLYADEFQHFATDSFETILSESGKFGLRLTLAHQFISQLSARMRNAVLGNAGTLIAFQLGIEDGEIIDKYTGYEPPKERHWVGASGERTMRIPGHGWSTLTLPRYSAIARAGTKTVLFKTRPLPGRRMHHAAEIKARMREMAPPPRPEMLAVPAPAFADVAVRPSRPPKN